MSGTPPACASWDDLARELELWAAASRPATLWWRDDDAVAPTPALDRLLDFAAQHDIPVALAVIPAPATQALAERVRVLRDRIGLLQHGFAHATHAAPGEKKAELGAQRPPEIVVAELAAGWRRLEALFGAAAPLPVLVPPWNRIAPPVISLLRAAGFIGLSTYGPRPAPLAAPGLLQVNAHVDIVDWRGSRGFVGEGAALGQLVGHLAARRRGGVDRQEPTGLMTHHLAHDEGCWAFVSELARRLAQHRAAVWLDAATIFNMRATGRLP